MSIGQNWKSRKANKVARCNKQTTNNKQQTTNKQQTNNKQTTNKQQTTTNIKQSSKMQLNHSGKRGQPAIWRHSGIWRKQTLIFVLFLCPNYGRGGRLGKNPKFEPKISVEGFSYPHNYWNLIVFVSWFAGFECFAKIDRRQQFSDQVLDCRQQFSDQICSADSSFQTKFWTADSSFQTHGSYLVFKLSL